MVPATGPSRSAPENLTLGAADPASEAAARDVAAIHRVGTDPRSEPQEQLQQYLAIGLKVLGLDGAVAARFSRGHLTLRAVAGKVAGIDQLDPRPALPADPRLVAVLDRQATVARLDGRGEAASALPLGPGAVVATPVWDTGQVVGLMAFVSDVPRATPFTPWQFALVELLADGVARLLEHEAIREQTPDEEAAKQSEQRGQTVPESDSVQSRAEGALASQVEFEGLVASISTRLIDCPPLDVDETIVGALGEITRFFDADAGFVLELTADRTMLRLSHEWRRPGIGDRHPSDSLSMAAVAWTARRLEQEPYILVRSVDELPPEAQTERAAFVAGADRALLWSRLGGGLDLAGIAGLVWKHRVPSQAEEQTLALVRLVGEAFLSALRRRSIALLASGQARVFELIARGAALPETLDAVARLLEMRCAGTTGAVLVVDESGRRLTVAAAPGLDPARQRMLDGLMVVSANPAGRAVKEREVVVVADALADSRFPEARTGADRLGARSITATPILSSRSGRALGALLLQGGEPHATDQLDEAWRESCGVLAAVAIERAEDEALLAFQATHDPLTGVSNRSAMCDRLELALARSKRSERSVAVLFCDLDRFKAVNDLYGHDQGDVLLMEVARRIQAVLRPSDTVARFGGDEFVVLCEDLDGPEQALQLATRVAEAVDRRKIAIHGAELTITASIGVALASENLDNPEALLRDADMAMYRAKAHGRARHELFHEGSQNAENARTILLEELGRAVSAGELRLHFQPIVSVDGPLRGVEALLRWRHPGRGIVHPSEFLATAEESGLIAPIGRWVIDEACRQLATWRDLDPRLRSLNVHVNLSSRQLGEPGMVEAFGAAADRAGVNPASFVMEVPERVLVEDAPGTAEVLAELARSGARIALDDFGTAYASLTSLRRFPVHALKIDQSFVERVGHDPEDTAIVKAVIELAHALGLEAVAEGVETAEQLATLREMGCDSAQGYLIARPAPAEELTDQLLSRLGDDGGGQR